MRAVLAELVVPPWEAEPMLVAVVESLPRQVWEGISNPDDVLLSLLRKACLEFHRRRRADWEAPSLWIERASPGGGESAGL
jgi:hypothetical protein